MHELLKTYRESAGLTVIQAAEKIGVTRASVYDWEAGRKMPEPANMRAIADAYSLGSDQCAKLAALRTFGVEATAS